MSTNAKLQRYNAVGELQLKEIGYLMHYWGYSGWDSDNLWMLKRRINQQITNLTASFELGGNDADSRTILCNVNLLNEILDLIKKTENNIMRCLEEKEKGGVQ